ncbi:MAG: membrane protein required for colicin V production [Halieaceae bacterium]|jgi:membrane protein required for colicin V production
MSAWPQLSLFNSLDWIVVVIVVLSALLSLWRGFVREAISLAGWLVAFLAANLFAVHLAELIGDLIANRTGRYIVAWSLLFVLVLVFTSLMARLFSKLISASGLGVLDRIFGTVFGVLRGCLIVMALLFVFRQLIPESEQSLLLESQLTPHIDLMLSWTMRVFEDFQKVDIPGISL